MTLRRLIIAMLIVLMGAALCVAPALCQDRDTDDSPSGHSADEISMGSLVIDGYHEGVGKIRESRLDVYLLPTEAPAYKVHFRLQFHAPFDWGDPDKVLEANVTLDREQFLGLVKSWNEAVERWLMSPQEMRSQGVHGKATDVAEPKVRYIDLLSVGEGPTKKLVLAFVDPRPLFTKKNEHVKRIDGLLFERDVNGMSRIMCRVLERARWQ